MARSLNTVAAGLYLVWGIALACLVPRLDQMYASLYSGWSLNYLLAVRAFHLPFYIWLLACLPPALGIYGLRRFAPDRKLAKWSAVALLLFVVLTAFTSSWLTGFVFCHSWGCGRWLG